MVAVTIYVEGGGSSKELRTRCREGFSKLFEKCGFKGRMPAIVSCGSRSAAFKDFGTAWAARKNDTICLLLVDSEDPVQDVESPWKHLAERVDDQWKKPAKADDRHALLMTTCMETWIIADRTALREHYGEDLQESALPSLQELEALSREEIQECLVRATRDCRNRYQKGTRSFQILAKIDPRTLKEHLPSFVRCLQVLEEKLIRS